MAEQAPLEGIVQRMIDAGESEENIGAVIQHYKSQQQAPAKPSGGGWLGGGTLSSNPPVNAQGQLIPSGAPNQDLSRFASRVGSNLNPINIAKGTYGLLKTAVTDPLAAGKQVLDNVTAIPRQIHEGQLPEALGDLTTLTALGIRSPKAESASVAGIPLEELKAAGVGKGTLDIMQHGRPMAAPRAASPGVLETRGNLALKPQAEALATPNAMKMPPPRGLSAGEEAGIQSLDQLLEAIHGGEQRPVGNGLYGRAPTEAPPSGPVFGSGAPPSPSGQKPKLDAVQTARMLRDQYGAEQGGRMLYGPVQKSADAIQSSANRTAMLKDLAAKSTLPDSARASIDTAIAKLAPEEAQAYFAKANPIAQKYMRSRWRDKIGEETGSVSPSALRMLGLPAELLKYPMMYHYGGPWGTAALGAVDAGRLMYEHPQGTAAAARAALLTGMATRSAGGAQ